MTNLKQKNDFDHFTQIIKDSVQLLKSGSIAYLFSKDQVNELLTIYPDLIIKESSGIYTVSLKKEKHGKQR